MSGKDIWDKLHWFNFPDLTVREVSDDTWFNDRVLPYLQNNQGIPLFVYCFNGYITKLKEINHDKKTVKYLNKVGIDFYLYEPLCSYLEDFDPDISDVFYWEFENTVNERSLRAKELDSILEYAERNGLTNIRVRTCDYEVDKYYPYYKNKLNLIYDDICIKHIQRPLLFSQPASTKIKKRFMCLNWRWARHRTLIAAFLAGRSSYVSYYFKCDFDDFKKRVWYDLDSWPNSFKNRIKKGFEYINENVPMNVDLNVEKAANYKKNIYPEGSLLLDDIYDPGCAMQRKNLEDYYHEIFCDIVTESRFAQPTANYSEKAQLPFWKKKPFILLAPPYTLKLLREEGYKTFGDFWDESYDECENHQERLFKIFNVIKYIESKSLEELSLMYDDMKDILEHNYKTVDSLIMRTRQEIPEPVEKSNNTQGLFAVRKKQSK